MARFEVGNTAALKHGGRSQRERERVRRELVAELHSVLLAEIPEDGRPRGTVHLIALAAVAAADVRQLHEYVNGQGGHISPRGQLRKCAEMMRAREHDLLGYFDRLGFGPRAAAQLVGALVAGNGGLASQLAAHQRRALAIPAERQP
jgi:plasmid stabilization system protein ParE